MKLTKSQLKQLIKEELQNVLKEQEGQRRAAQLHAAALNERFDVDQCARWKDLGPIQASLDDIENLLVRIWNRG